MKLRDLIKEGVGDEIDAQYKKLQQLSKDNQALVKKKQTEFNDEVKKYEKLISTALDGELSRLKSTLSKLYKDAKITQKETTFVVSYKHKAKENKYGDFEVPNKKYLFDYKTDEKRKIEKSLNTTSMVNIEADIELGYLKDDLYDYGSDLEIEVSLTKSYIKKMVNAKSAPSSGILNVRI